VEETRTAGDLVVELAKRSSAYYAPSAAIAELSDSIHMNLNRLFSVSVMMDGEYGLKDAALSLPSLIGSRGAERVLTPELTPQEIAILKESARKITAALRGETAPVSQSSGARGSTK